MHYRKRKETESRVLKCEIKGMQLKLGTFISCLKEACDCDVNSYTVILIMAKTQLYLWNSHYVSITLLRTLESMFHLIETECLIGSYYCYPHITNEKDSGLQGLKDS